MARDRRPSLVEQAPHSGVAIPPLDAAAVVLFPARESSVEVAAAMRRLPSIPVIMPSARSLSRLVAIGVLSAACADRTVPVAPTAVVLPEVPAQTSTSVALTCRASVAALSVSCASEAPKLGAQGDIIVGGQNVYVKLTSTVPAYNSGTGAFTFDVTVQNLLPQAMGTTNGTSTDGTGVRVFFQTLPVATTGTGSIAVTNATGTDLFTASNQTFFQYPAALLGADGILSTNEVSASTSWAFNVPATVGTFAFTVYVSANVPASTGYVTVSPGSASVIATGTQALSATVRSAVGNTIPGQTVSWATSDAAVATVASDGTITAVAPGAATITATSGTRTGTTTVQVCPNLALGGVAVITGPTAASFCLAGSTGNEYVVVPYNGDPAATLDVSVTGTGISAVSDGPTPTPYVGASTPSTVVDLFARRRDVAAEARLRARERALAPLISSARASLGRRSARSSGLLPGRPSRSITPGVPTVGDVMNLNVSLADCSAPEIQAATVKSVGTHSVIMAQNDNNQVNTFTQAEYDAIAASFDDDIYPLMTGTFGAPFDTDNNGGRIVILFTRKVNQMYDPMSGGYTGGFVYARDLFPVADCATSNLGEMFYMLAPDSTGVDGMAWTATQVMTVTTGTLAHEFEHLINASRRIYVNGASVFESGWLDEGLAHVAEELLFNSASGITPGSGTNLAAIVPQPTQTYFFTYAESNFGRFRSHLLSPETNSAQQSDDDLATRGAAWAFLRYAADRAVPAPASQSAFWSSLVNSTTAGSANLTAVLGTSVDPWFRDFAAAVYSSNMGVGTVSGAYSMPSWDFRSIYGALDYGPGVGYPLADVNPASGAAYSPTLALGGGAAYVRMGVAASTFAPITITKAGGGALPSTFSAMVIRRK